MKFTTAIAFIVLATVVTTGIEARTVRGSTTHINRLSNPTLAQGERYLMMSNSMKSSPKKSPPKKHNPPTPKPTSNQQCGRECSLDYDCANDGGVWDKGQPWCGLCNNNKGRCEPNYENCTNNSDCNGDTNLAVCGPQKYCVGK